jgi:hypothetical protein
MLVFASYKGKYNVNEAVDLIFKGLFEIAFERFKRTFNTQKVRLKKKALV